MASIREKKQNGKVISYQFTCCLGRDGQGKQIRRYGYWTPPQEMTPAKARRAAQKAAEEWEQTERQEYAKDLASPERVKIKELVQTKMDFSAFVSEVWFPIRIGNGEFKAKTVSFYLDTTKNIKKYFQGYLISNIDSIAIQKFLIYLRNDMGFSAQYVHHHYRTLNMIFGFAAKQGIIPENPMLDVARPRLEKKAVEALSVKEAKQFFAALADCPLDFRCMLNLMITTGIRRGECVGLKWRDIDEKHSVIRIERNDARGLQGLYQAGFQPPFFHQRMKKPHAPAGKQECIGLDHNQNREWVSVPEFCKPCLFLCLFQFAQFIVPYRLAVY